MNMSKLSSKRPVTPNKCDVEGDLQCDHWSKAVYENDLLLPNEGTLDFTVEGGSDNGEFPYFGIILEQNNSNISNHDIILEIQGQKIAGYTQRDVIAWLNHCCRNGNPVIVKAVKAGHLTKDLRRYLNTRFQKGSVDHDLQNTIRDNLYLRTVPCTTRSPRDGEVNGVDYTFLTAEEFIALERSGNLLESGIYEGNHYGTPKPPKDSSVSPPRRSNSISTSSNIVPGAHASSEGKRRRNRSNVEAMAAKATDPSDSAEYPLLGLSSNTRSSTPVSVLSSHSGYRKCGNLAISESPYFSSCHSELGPLPDNWEKAYTENGEPYFIDHNSGTSQWLDPRVSRVQKKTIEDCGDDELPFGWERIDDPHYGTYYIDHVNRRTQYENPVLQARRITQNASLAEFNNATGSWHQKQDRRGSSGTTPHAASADSKESPHHSRNNSLTQIPNSSNSHGQIGTGNTNSESYLISSNSHLPNATSNPSSIPPSNNMSSSPASTHRFPYLHCIPCLNEKHEPNASPPKHGTDKKVEGIVGNGTINSNSATNVEDRESDSASHQPNITRAPSFTPVNNISGINRPGNAGSRNEDISCRASSPLTASSLPGYISRPKPPYVFTRNPDELQGEFIQTPLIKSSRGFGFTIVGGDDETAEEFLQIKNVVPNGPAWCDGKLQMGDVLVHVNNVCVLGYTHQDVVELFQSIPPGEIVNLEVCRGYPLPFDPNDPNTEIVTTVAVTMANTRTSESQAVYSSSRYNASCTSGKVVNSAAVESIDSMSRTAKSMPDLSSKQSEHIHPLRHNSAGLLSPVAIEHTPNLNSTVISKKPESLTVEIVKGTAGFGFTIADSAYGQKVKKILDRPRCKQLQEGDILIEINGHEVRGLPHAEVVQLLKDCPCEDVARITVQRGGMFSPLKSKGKSKIRTSEDVNGFSKSNGNEFTIHASSFSPSPKRTDLSHSQTVGGYRSKTPTADLYSSRDKESVSITRPKTPLVDTRNWSRTSSSDLLLEDNNSRLSREVDKMPVINSEREYASSRPYEHSSIRTGMYGSSPERQGNPSWYSDHSRGRDWSSHNFRDPNRLQCYESSVQRDPYSYNNVSEDLQQNSSYQGHSKVTQAISHANVLPREDGLASRSLHSQDWRNAQTDSIESSPVQYTLMSNSNYSQEFGRAIYIPSQEYPVLHSHSNKVHSLSSPVYQLQPSSYYASQLTGTNICTPQSSSLQQDSAACREIHSTSHNFPTSSVYSSRTVTQLDNFHHKKHSTSFEHEHPVSSNMPHYSRDTRPVLNDNAFPNNAGLSNQSNTTTECVDMTITLQRQESGFGFRIVGGTEEGSQVSVGHIVPGGAADVDGRLRSGDEIIGVDGQLVINTSHHHVVQLMGNAARSGKVILQLRRQVASTDHSFQSKSLDGIFPYDITVTRNENEGFGFVIISSVSRAGSTIGRIIEGSPAERCGQLHVGDTILAVNGVNILNMHHGDIVNLIKDSGYSVNLTIGHPHDDVSSTASVSQKGEDISLEQDEHFHAVELHRGTRGFGFSIRGGKEFQNMPLFVLRIAENGPAYQDGRLQVGDQIIDINGVNTKNMTHAEAIELIRQGGSLVRLLVKRGNKLPSSLEQSSSLLQAFTPVSLSPLSSPVLNGPISQSSPRTTTQTEHTTQEIYNWSYEPH